MTYELAHLRLVLDSLQSIRQEVLEPHQRSALNTTISFIRNSLNDRLDEIRDTRGAASNRVLPPEDSIFERTFTGTWIGRNKEILEMLQREEPEESH